MALKSISGGSKLQEKLNEIAKKVSAPATLKVGFFEDASYPDGTPVAAVAAWNEFGSRSTPPRPFFRTAVAENSQSWGEGLAKRLASNGYDVKDALGAVGEVIQGQVRDSIVQTNSPPNSPVTNLIKQRFPMGGQTFDDVLKAIHDVAEGVTAPAGSPLQQSGQMLRDVKYQVDVE